MLCRLLLLWLIKNALNALLGHDFNFIASDFQYRRKKIIKRMGSCIKNGRAC